MCDVSLSLSQNLTLTMSQFSHTYFLQSLTVFETLRVAAPIYRTYASRYIRSTAAGGTNQVPHLHPNR